ncbi:hypothetical protein MQE36_02805 [Zhouia spongiae]|uniref:Fibrobacter succinogenes major paralogous domain-containing protein n=1 Tax=Zhouia spongiae TaxID=2202721 RepID=A0ABY3YN80_9FLAO|nr:FISUMP domain-containing protein [Zhouia spongiae]UNY99282.1 hypothetical protein MQE36_02805 [Zhouia spongiae]
MKQLTLGLLLCFGLLTSCNNDDDSFSETFETGTYTDKRDGQEYPTIRIGDQIWMSENMRFDTNDTESICYANETYNCFVYGKLYTGNAAQTVCPEGWHLPSTEEWDELFDYFGGTDVAYAFLEPYGKIQGHTIEFNILPAGRYIGSFQNILEEGHYWTSTDGGYPDSYRYINYKPGASFTTPGASQTVMQSCRCIKDGD